MTISPDGALHKCISLVGRPDFQVGTVFDDDYDDVEYDRQMDTVKRTEECWDEACPYIPVCAGGCAYESIVRTGDYRTRFCTKPNLEAWHYKKYFLQFEDRLAAVGAQPLTVDQLRESATTVGATLPMASTGGGGGCGCGAPAPEASVGGLLQIAPMPARPEG